MVGDVKQSIYRFRLADPTIFLSKYDAYPPLGTQAPGEPRKLLLSQNFRSRAEILEAVNDVFSLVMKKEAGELDYTQDEALVPGAQFPDSPGPKVELHCLNYLASEEESGDKTGAEAEFVAARIERLLRDGLRHGERRAAPGEAV
ncbi:MAG: UvrD-helicase domain-containing protein [Acutalibacteraceae bacterium]